MGKKQVRGRSPKSSHRTFTYYGRQMEDVSTGTAVKFLRNLLWHGAFPFQRVCRGIETIAKSLSENGIASYGAVAAKVWRQKSSPQKTLSRMRTLLFLANRGAAALGQPFRLIIRGKWSEPNTRQILVARLKPSPGAGAKFPSFRNSANLPADLAQKIEQMEKTLRRIEAKLNRISGALRS